MSFLEFRTALQQRAAVASATRAQTAARKSLAQQALDAKSAASLSEMTEEQLRAILAE